MSPIRPVFAVAFLLTVAGLAWADEKPAARNDVFGDPLPSDAQFRLGTSRLRDGDYISAAALSPDGKTWAVAGRRDSIQLWDVASGRQTRDFKGSRSGISASHLVYSPDGRFLAVSDITGSLQLLDAATGNAVRSLEGGPRIRTGRVSFSADGRFLTAGDENFGDKSSILVWETDTGKKLGPFQPLQNYSVQAVLSPDGKLLASWGQYHGRANESEEERARPRTVQLWDVSSGKERGRVVVEGYGISRTAFAPDGRSIAVASGQASIEVWEVATAKRRLQLVGRRGQGSALLFSPDARTLAAATHDGVVQRWDLATGKRLSTDEGPKCSLLDLRYSRGGQLLAWGTTGQAPCIWEVDTGKRLTPEAGHTTSISALVYLDGGRTLASIGNDNTLFFWDAQAGKERRRVEIRNEDDFGRRSFRTHGFVFTPDGRHMISGGDFTSPARMWELPAVKEVCGFESTRGDEFGLVVSPDGRKLAGFGRHRGGIHLWDLETGQSLAPLQGLEAGQNNRILRQLGGVAFSPDGKMVAASIQTLGARNDQMLYVWDVANGKQLYQWKSNGTPVLAYTPDAKALVTATSGSDICLRDPANGKEILKMEGGAGYLTAPLTFSPDGRTMVVCTSDRETATSKIQLWELATGQVRRELTGHRGSVTAVTFSPDGRTLATGGADTTILVWDLMTGAAR
jgi:WD40 repeat protein